MKRTHDRCVVRVYLKNTPVQAKRKWHKKDLL